MKGGIGGKPPKTQEPKKTPNKSDYKLAFFSAQFNGLLVGEGKRFKTFDDLCKFAHGECGYDGVSLDTGMLDLEKMTRSEDYRQSVIEHYEKLGTPIVNLANHVVGQLMCMHPAVWPRFRGFAPAHLRHCDYETVQAWASKRMALTIEVASLLGVDLHTFPGSKAVPVVTDPWNAHPTDLEGWELAALAEAWEPHLESACNCSVNVGFEIRHIMEGIVTAEQLFAFRDVFLGSTDAKQAVKWAIDISHYEIEGDDPTYDVQLCEENGLLVANLNHAKQGFFDEKQLGHCRRPANMPWARRAGKFCTFGIFNQKHARRFLKAVQNAEDSGREKYVIMEGECMFLRHPIQSMSIGAENIRRGLNGKEFIPFEEIALEPWDGPAFDKFADSGYTAAESLALSGNESEAVYQRLQDAKDRGYKG